MNVGDLEQMCRLYRPIFSTKTTLRTSNIINFINIETAIFSMQSITPATKLINYAA